MAKHGRHSANIPKARGSSASSGRYAGAPASRYASQQPGYASRGSHAHARQQGGQAYGVPSGHAGMYSRDNYGSGATGAYARPYPKRSSTGKRVAKVIGIIVAVCLVGAAAYALWFSSALNSALSPSDETRLSVADQLVSVPLNEPFYMLILGSDSREGSGTSKDPSQQGDQERSDVIMLARIDASNRQVTLVSIPRDTPYHFDDGRVTKINETFNEGGAGLTIKAVSELTGEKISHYALVYVSDLESIVDHLGGVEVTVDRNLSVKDTLTGKMIKIEKGTQTLDGRHAQVFVRARHEYNKEGETMDGSRQSNVRTLAEAIVKKTLDRPVFELPGTILGLAQYVETDLTAADLLSLGSKFYGGKTTFYSCNGPIDGYIAEEYGGIFLCYENPEGWAELMRQVDAGLEPTEIDYESTQIVPDSV